MLNIDAAAHPAAQSYVANASQKPRVKRCAAPRRLLCLGLAGYAPVDVYVLWTCTYTSAKHGGDKPQHGNGDRFPIPRASPRSLARAVATQTAPPPIALSQAMVLLGM